MEGDNNSVNGERGRHTFLSRVFGMQSGEMGTSIGTNEMSRFPLSPNMNSSIKLSSSEISRDVREEDLRVPESDQGTSSNEEEEEEFQSEPLDFAANDDDNKIQVDSPKFEGGENLLVHSGYARNAKTNDSHFKLSTSFESIRKTGQESTDDDADPVGRDREGSGHISNDEYGQYKFRNEYGNDSSEALLFDKANDALPAGDNKATNNGEHSLLFNRIYQKMNQSKINKNEALFTASNNYSMGKTQIMNNDMSFKNQKSFERRTNTRFGSSKEQSFENKLYPFRPPNLLPNIKVVNNTPANRINTLSAKEKALWKWANVENLDVFLQNVYNYYLGNGFNCIISKKILDLATLVFVIFLSTYLGNCINFEKLKTSDKLSEVLVDQCYRNSMTGLTRLLLYGFYLFVVLKVIQFFFDIRNLKDMHDFYFHLLNISDKELQTIPWQNVIQQLMLLKDQNALTANVVEVKAKNKIDPLTVANRIMRKENYLIALYNENILNLSLPIPLYRTSTLTKTLEWNINLCIMGLAFNEAGFLKQSFLKTSQHSYIAEELRKRFMLAGFLNIVLSPFLVCYFVLLYFLRYFNEYKTSPSALNTRQYTPMAEWKFREYNELYHIFQKRLGLSTEIADKYINQFPKELTNIYLKFVAFVSGSFVAVLASLAIFDSENFLNFEITTDKSVLFYVTIFGTIWTLCKNSVSEKYKIFDPEESVEELAEFTHYLPEDWAGRYHTEDVKNDFCKLYNLRVIILLRELASLILTPFILWFSLPKCANQIVEFFGNSTLYSDGLGYACKYALFDVDSIENNNKGRSKSGKLNERAEVNEGQLEIDENAIESDSDSQDSEGQEQIDKMMKSYMYFIDDYENADNAVGKTQIVSVKSKEPASNKHFSLDNKQLWRKQFGPGQRPELFKIGKHALSSDLNYQNSKPSKRSSVTGMMDNSFINSGVFNKDDLTNSYITRANGKNNGGILKMVKEYYKSSDVGR